MMCDSIFRPDEHNKPTIVITDTNQNNTSIETSPSTSADTTASTNVSIHYVSDDEAGAGTDAGFEDSDNEVSEKNNVSFIGYNLEEEQNMEKMQNEYHIEKTCGDWHYSKMIVSHAYQDKNNTEFFCDYLERLFQKNGDSFENIHTSYYKNDLDIDIVYEFSQAPAKHLIDNLRIPAFKPNGIIFSNPEDANKWSFKIVVITNKGIYTANRYITEELIGCY